MLIQNRDANHGETNSVTDNGDCFEVIDVGLWCEGCATVRLWKVDRSIDSNAKPD